MSEGLEEKIKPEFALKIYEIDEIYDRMFLLGFPGIGKSFRIRYLALVEAAKMGKEYFIDATEIVAGKPVKYLRKIPGATYSSAIIIDEYWDRESFRKEKTYWSFDEFLDKYNNINDRKKMYFFFYTPAPHILPTDLGVPNVMTREDYFFPKLPFWIKILSDPYVDGVWFIDEITNVSEMAVLTIFYAAIQERRLGFARIGDAVFDPATGITRGIKIVTAGNPKRYGGAMALPAPLLNRLMTINVLRPQSVKDVEEWIDFMDMTFSVNPKIETVEEEVSGKTIRKRVITATEYRWERLVGLFLTAMPNRLCASKIPPRTLEPFESPRSWTNLALWLYKVKKEDEIAIKNGLEPRFTYMIGENKLMYNPSKIKPFVYGFVGPDSATVFISFISHRPPTVEEVCRALAQKDSWFYSGLSSISMTMRGKEIEKEKENSLLKFLWSIVVLGENIEYLSDECFETLVNAVSRDVPTILSKPLIAIVSARAKKTKSNIIRRRKEKLQEAMIERAVKFEVQIEMEETVIPHMSMLTYDWWKKHAKPE